MMTYKILFFFQAEDGIRDFHVTGVQTCALPIWQSSDDHLRRAQLLETLALLGRAHDGRHGRTRLCRQLQGESSDPAGRAGDGQPLAGDDGELERPRSEERRVGKEWRARWRAER